MGKVIHFYFPIFIQSFIDIYNSIISAFDNLKIDFREVFYK